MQRRKFFQTAMAGAVGLYGLASGTSLYASGNLPNASYPALFSDSFNYANRSPLNPTNWYSVGGVPSANDCLEVVNNECVSTIQVQADGQATVIGETFPNNQWCAITLRKLAQFGAIFLYVRANHQNINPCYAVWLTGPDTESGSSRGSITVFQISQDGGSRTYTWLQNSPFRFIEGSQYAFAVNSTKLMFLANGTLAWSGLLSASPILIPSGTVGMQLAPVYCQPLESGQVAVADFYAGNVLV